MAPSRASFVLLRDELLEREAFDTLLEANVSMQAVDRPCSYKHFFARQ